LAQLSESGHPFQRFEQLHGQPARDEGDGAGMRCVFGMGGTWGFASLGGLPALDRAGETFRPALVVFQRVQHGLPPRDQRRGGDRAA
jgi:hypothetical protein